MTNTKAKEKVRSVMNNTADDKKNKNLKGYTSGKVKDLFEMYKVQIAQALPKHIKAERMIQIATTVVTRNPAILECTQSSIVGALMQASILGFSPVEALGFCYLVPFNNNVGTRQSPNYVKEVQFQIGYKGYIELARRSGRLSTIYAYAVYEGDDFNYELGLNPKLHHIPAEADTKNRKLTHAYAVAHYKDGGYNFIVLRKDEIERLRLRSPMNRKDNSLKGAWATDYEAMAKAKAIKQLGKYMPLSEEMMVSFESDDKVIKSEDFANDNSGMITSFDYSDASGQDADYEVVEDSSNTNQEQN